MGLSIQTLGELMVRRDGQVLPLPASKKTRALLAYLALTARPHRRDRLCEMLFELPDDPRAALRWSLNKLRPLVNDGACERLIADRERVALQTAGIEIDMRSLEARVEEQTVDADELSAIAERLEEPLLDGLDLPNQQPFQRWLVGGTRGAREVENPRARALGAASGSDRESSLEVEQECSRPILSSRAPPRSSSRN